MNAEDTKKQKEIEKYRVIRERAKDRAKVPKAELLEELYYAAIELLAVADTRADSQLPEPCNDPKIYSARMQDAWDDLRCIVKDIRIYDQIIEPRKGSEAVKHWRRHRFYTSSEDYRPIKWPPPGPYWCSGETDDAFILIAYIPQNVKLEDYWPEAERAEFTDEDEIIFSDRFAKPDWWPPPQGPPSRRRGRSEHDTKRMA
jgi:Ni/Co efflux regulator RcnB